MELATIEHDPEKPAADLIRGGNWFSEKTMLTKKPERQSIRLSNHALGCRGGLDFDEEMRTVES
jgi:hypothetical protein